jgi:hypothetical protein
MFVEKPQRFNINIDLDGFNVYIYILYSLKYTDRRFYYDNNNNNEFIRFFFTQFTSLTVLFSASLYIFFADRFGPYEWGVCMRVYVCTSAGLFKRFYIQTSRNARIFFLFFQYTQTLTRLNSKNYFDTKRYRYVSKYTFCYRLRTQ